MNDTFFYRFKSLLINCRNFWVLTKVLFWLKHFGCQIWNLTIFAPILSEISSFSERDIFTQRLVQLWDLIQKGVPQNSKGIVFEVSIFAVNRWKDKGWFPFFLPGTESISAALIKYDLALSFDNIWLKSKVIMHKTLPVIK